MKVKIQIAKEDDREKVAGILVKNGIAVAPVRDYAKTKSGQQAKNIITYLVIDAEAVND